MTAALRKNWYLYLFGLIMVYGLKRFYSSAAFDDLGWILAPTSWWAGILSGTHFEKLAHVGYVSHVNEFIIVPSCSGVNYFIILFAALLYSFIHRWSTVRAKLLWLASSIGTAYVLTVFVNGFRVVLAMYLFHAHIYGSLITPERIHRLEGVVVYLGSLFLIFILAEKVLGLLGPGRSGENAAKQPRRRIKNAILVGICPFSCYFLITLGIPLLNGAYRRNFSKFMEHTMVIAAVFFLFAALYYLTALIKFRLREGRSNI